MIKISNVEEEYYTCNGCDKKGDLKNISVGLTEHHTHTVRLCKDCREELIRKLGDE